mmetsp:Transcript_48702/g.137689  ORF Transcript_48702/g.137689 Transcript_48702/m.137689 type:complete len:149 (-) Transcript_48702:125-571(-)
MAAVTKSPSLGPRCAFFAWTAAILACELQYVETEVAWVWKVHIFAAALGCFMCLQEDDLDLPCLGVLSGPVLGGQGAVVRWFPPAESYWFWVAVSTYMLWGSWQRMLDSPYIRFWRTLTFAYAGLLASEVVQAMQAMRSGPGAAKKKT